MPKQANISAEDRAVRAMNMRIQGVTYDQIADRLGYASKGSAHNAVKNLLDNRKAESVDELRAQGQARYETIIREMTLILSERTRETEITDNGVEEKLVPVHGPAERTAAARAIVRAQDSLNRLYGLNIEQSAGTSSHQFLIVEADVLTNNMQNALMDNPSPLELGEVIDVVVDDE